MKIFKPTYKDKSGKTKKCQSWYIGFTDKRQKRRRLPAFSNKKQTEKAAEKIEELIASGATPELQSWLEQIPDKMRNNLIKFGLIDQQRVSSHIGKSLADHVKDFHESLLAKGNGKPYVKQVSAAIQSVFTECAFTVWSDIDANCLYTYLADLRGDDGIGERTFNFHLKAVKQFCRWMIKERRATSSPLEHLSCVTQTEKRRQRRALTIEQQRLLVEVTANGPKHHNMTGYERALLYRMALQTGLRANELRSLAVSCFDFDNRTVTLTGAYTKNKKLAVQGFTESLAVDMKAYIANKLPITRVFAVPNQPAKMIKADLKVAGIEYKTAEGQADFHSLRHSFCTNLARAGVHPSDAMVLARHSTITMTMNYYTHVKRDSLQGIIDNMPDLALDRKRKIG